MNWFKKFSLNRSVIRGLHMKNHFYKIYANTQKTDFITYTHTHTHVRYILYYFCDTLPKD